MAALDRNNVWLSPILLVISGLGIEQYRDHHRCD